MKKVIRNKVYDTEKAHEVGSFEVIVGDVRAARRDEHKELSDYTETLFKKKTGEYFLHGTGSAGSKYGRMSSLMGDRIGGEEIIPLTWEQARRWAEEHLEKDVYDEYFGDDTRDVQLATNVSAATKNKIAEIASYWGVSQRAVIDNVFEKLTLDEYTKQFKN